MAERDTIDTYGPEWREIMDDFLRPGVPPSEAWSKLAAYHGRHGNGDCATWCSQVAGGASYDDADRVFHQREQAAPGMRGVVDVPALGL